VRLTESTLALGYESGIDCFGFCFGGFGLDGAMFLSLSNPKPLPVGIALVSAYSGVSDHVQRNSADHK
jgi:hypothetical protein